jgi:hypothetical protein
MMLKKQTEQVEVWNSYGRRVRAVSPAYALSEILPHGRFVGVGSEVRIHHIRPEVPITGWRGRQTTQRVRNDGGTIIAPDFVLEHKPLVTQ